MIEKSTMIETIDATTQHRSLWVDVWRQFCKHKGAMTGVIVFIFITIFVTIGPLIHDIEPSAINFRERNLGPTLAHPLGTDNIGHDTLAQMLAGGQVSLAVGFLSMMISLLLGTFIGVLAGFFKSLDGPLMRLTDLFLALPILPLLLVIILLFRDTLRTLYGPEAGIFMLIVFIIGITSWMHTARIVRGDVLGIKEREFVTAAYSIGTKKRRIIFRHILPNVLGPVIVISSANFAAAILIEAGLSFLGIGAQPPIPSWGGMIKDHYSYIIMDKAFLAIIPGLAIMSLVLSFMLLGNGLRDAFDVKN